MSIQNRTVSVRVNGSVYDRVLAQHPRGWFPEQVRLLLEAADSEDVPVLELGPVDDDLSNMRVIGNSVTGVTGGDGSPRTKRGHSPTCKCAVCA